MNIIEEQLLEIQILAKLEYLHKFRSEIYQKRTAILKELGDYGTGKKFYTNDMAIKKLQEAQEICNAINSVEVEFQNLVKGNNSLKCISAGVYYVMKQNRTNQVSSFDEDMGRDLVDLLLIKTDDEMKKIVDNLDMAIGMSKLFRLSVNEYFAEDIPEVDELIMNRTLSTSKYYKPM